MATKRFNQAAFDQAMNELFRIADEDDFQELIADYAFDFDRWDNESEIVPCIFTEQGMRSILYYMCNYDYICVNKNGKVDTEESNCKEMAELIAPYITTKNGKWIINNLY